MIHIRNLEDGIELFKAMEISSEAPGVNSDRPSDISFFLNDVWLGYWMSPGDFGNMRGIFTPEWWFSGWNQYGLSPGAGRPRRRPDSFRKRLRQLRAGNHGPDPVQSHGSLRGGKALTNPAKCHTIEPKNKSFILGKEG